MWVDGSGKGEKNMIIRPHINVEAYERKRAQGFIMYVNNFNLQEKETRMSLSENIVYICMSTCTCI